MEKITTKVMSEIENEDFLANIHEQIEQAVVDNDVDQIRVLYNTLREHGFDKEADSVRDSYALAEKSLFEETE